MYICTCVSHLYCVCLYMCVSFVLCMSVRVCHTCTGMSVHVCHPCTVYVCTCVCLICTVLVCIVHINLYILTYIRYSCTSEYVRMYVCVPAMYAPVAGRI